MQKKVHLRNKKGSRTFYNRSLCQCSFSAGLLVSRANISQIKPSHKMIIAKCHHRTTEFFIANIFIQQTAVGQLIRGRQFVFVEREIFRSARLISRRPDRNNVPRKKPKHTRKIRILSGANV